MINLLYYNKIPSIATEPGALTHAELSVMIQLCRMHLVYCKNNYEKEFYLTDRFLAKAAYVSTKTVWKTKKKLVEIGAIKYRIIGNKTYYKIMLES